MSKYLIEVHHNSDKFECHKSMEVFLSSGSHFLTNADWGCMDGVHKAWFMMDADNKDEVMRIVPPAYRKDTIIVQLSKFRPKDFEELQKHHGG
jgi:hypothetical protein